MNDRTYLVLQARIALALVGALLFGYGVRVDDPTYRLAGIATLAVSLLLRWWKPGRRDAAPSGGSAPSAPDDDEGEPRS